MTTQNHRDRLQSAEKSKYLQSFIAINKNDFGYKFVSAFLKADIPLHKLSNPAINELFESIGQRLPSESTCRRNVELIHKNAFEVVKKPCINVTSLLLSMNQM